MILQRASVEEFRSHQGVFRRRGAGWGSFGRSVAEKKMRKEGFGAVRLRGEWETESREMKKQETSCCLICGKL